MSFLDDVVAQLVQPDAYQEQPPECWSWTSIAKDVDLLYPHFYDPEQLYDLDADPNCKTNLVDDYEYAAVVDMCKRKMREYLADICIAAWTRCPLSP